jgi:phosphonoacetaldehyde hydrolase
LSGKVEIRLVVFDWAGTTVDFGCRGPTEAFIEVFAASGGVPVSQAEARAPMGLAKKQHLAEMLRLPAVAGRWRSAHGRAPTEEDVETLYRAVTPRQVANAARFGALVPGLLACVEELRSRGIRIGATTGYFREAALAAARAAAEHGYEPDCSVCTDEVAVGRPAPWMLLRVMERLNVYPPATVVKVGDTAVDMAEGRNAGCWCVGVVDSSNGMGLSPEEFAALTTTQREGRRAEVRRQLLAAGAHLVVDSVAELPEALHRLSGCFTCGSPAARPPAPPP